MAGTMPMALTPPLVSSTRLPSSVVVAVEALTAPITARLAIEGSMVYDSKRYWPVEAKSVPKWQAALGEQSLE